jgi:hypothetical protein
MEFPIADDAFVARFADEDEGGLIPAAGGEVAVEAVVAGVDFAIGKPFGERRVPFEALGERLEPMQLLDGELRPELIGIGLRPFAESAIGVGTLHLCMANEIVARRIGRLVAHGIRQGPVYRRGWRLRAAVKNSARSVAILAHFFSPIKIEKGEADPVGRRACEVDAEVTDSKQRHVTKLRGGF